MFSHTMVFHLLTSTSLWRLAKTTKVAPPQGTLAGQGMPTYPTWRRQPPLPLPLPHQGHITFGGAGHQTDLSVCTAIFIYSLLA